MDPQRLLGYVCLSVFVISLVGVPRYLCNGSTKVAWICLSSL